MNKRRREILAALTPAVERAMSRGKQHSKDVPGLALHARPAANAPAELMIYGRIGGGGWFDEGISANDVAALLKEAGPGPINVRINSGGGDVFDGIAIHTLLARHPGTVTTYVDGLAASAASFIMLAGDRIVSARNAMVMIHDGMTGTYGNAATHRRAVELLDKVSANIADMYAERAGEDAEHWRELMNTNGEDGFWYTGQEAFEAGLVDELTEVKDDGPEEDLVWDRLAGWTEVLPEAVRDLVWDRLSPAGQALPEAVRAEDLADVKAIVDGPVIEEVTAEPAEGDGSDDDDFAYSMSMWAYLNGRTAVKGS